MMKKSRRITRKLKNKSQQLWYKYIKSNNSDKRWYLLIKSLNKGENFYSYYLGHIV